MRIISKIAAAHKNHKERHRPTGLGLALYDSISFVNAGDWDHVVAKSSYFLSREYLGVLESAKPDNFSLRFGILYRESRPVAAFHAQFVEVSAGQVTHKKALSKLRQRLLLAGDLLSTGQHGVAFAPDEDPSALWPGIAEALYRLRRSEKLRGQTDLVIVKDFSENDPVPEALRRFDYRPLQTEPNMVLDFAPTWKTYEDYVASMTSKYRKGIREIEHRVQEAGYQLEVVRDLESLAPRLQSLYLQVHAQAHVRLFELSPTFLPSLARAAGERFSCTILRKGETVAGFVTTVRDRDTTVGSFIGFDRSLNKSVPIYFRLLQVVVEKAIADGSAHLSFGRTALEPKARLGARPVPMSVWVRHRVPALNLLVRQLIGRVSHQEAPERNPFK